mgnify:CR=1 FL=1
MKNSSLYPCEAGFAPRKAVPVGGLLFAEEPIHYNEGRPVITLRVKNRGDRPIQIGSHFHLFEANRYLEFDRKAAFGCHLNIPATTAIRFEPGEEKSVEVVPFAGKSYIIGFGGLTNGYAGGESAPTYYPTFTKAMKKAEKRGYKSTKE